MKEAITLNSGKKLITLLISVSMLIGFSTILAYPAKATSEGTAFFLSTQYGGITITGSQICYYAGPADKGGYAVQTLSADDKIVICGCGNYGIDVIAGQISTFDIVLQNANINTSGTKDESALDIGPNATVNLKLEGNNTLKSGENGAGIQVPETAVLNFESYKDNSGTLNVTGGKWAAGIGGGFVKASDGFSNLQGVGKINLNYYPIYAVGGDFSAGIGGGWGKDGGQITINGGNVTAIGGNGGAAIGGGDGGSGGTININNGNITALRTYKLNSDTSRTYQIDSASIGGGNHGNGGNINITGGTVLAKPIDGSAEAELYDLGTGIGGGWGGDGGTINISGGNIMINCRGIATGIGGGFGFNSATGSGGSITISGGSVSVACKWGTAIGGGSATDHDAGAGGTINISGGYVDVFSVSGIAIGGGLSTSKMGGAGANLTITGGTVIADIPDGSNSVNIGSSTNNQNKGTCTIDGGSVSANRIGPIPRNTAGSQVYLATVTIPGVTSPTVVSYYTDPAKQYSCSTDGDGKLFLWLPETVSPLAINISKSGNVYTASGIVTTGENTFSATQAVSSPAITLSSANTTGGGLAYSITPVSGESAYIESYVIQLYNASGTAPIGNPITTASASGSITLASGITEGTSYTAKVKAIATTVGGRIDSLYGALCTATQATRLSVPLHAPGIALSPSSTRDGGLDYTITPVSNEIAHVSNYSIQLYDGTEASPVVFTTTALTDSIPISSLTIGMTYQVRVQAIAARGSGYSNSDTSALSATTTPGSAWTPLTAPMIALTSSGAGGLNYTITPVQTETQIVTSYTIQLYHDAGTSTVGGPISVSASSLTGNIPLSLIGTAGGNYKAKVMAVTNAQRHNNSMYSALSASAKAASNPTTTSGRDSASQGKIATGMQPDGSKLIEVGVPVTNNGGLVTGSVTDVRGMLSSAGQTSSGELDFRFNLPSTSGTTGATLSFAGTSFNQLVETGGTMTFSSQFGSLNFSSGALESIAKASNGGSVSLALNKSPTVNTGSGPRPAYDIGVQAGGKSITSFGGATIDFSLPYTPQPGEALDALVMCYHGPHGDVPVRGFFRNNTMSASTVHLSEYYIGYNKVTFQDVPSESWYYNAVTFIAAREITTGTGSGLFSPEKTLTRGEFVTMLLRAYYIEPDADLIGNFSDAGNTYYTGYLATAKRLGIAQGAGENKFEPEKELTRQDMFTLLNRILTILDQRTAGESKNVMSNFSDASSVSNYAHEAVKTLVENGVISGSNGKINPTGLTNRAEMAQTLYKLLSQ